jgi:hypothetical protein
MFFNQASFPLNLLPQFLFRRQVKHIFRCEELLAVLKYGIFCNGLIFLGAQDEPDGGRFKKEAILAVLDGPLQGVDGFQLIGAQKAQLVGLDVAGALGFILPRRFGRITRPLGEDDVVIANLLFDEALRVGRDFLVADHRIRRRERGDDVGIAAFEIPEVVQVAVRENDEAAVLVAGVFAGLLLADKWVLVLCLGFKDDERETLGVEKQKVDVALGCLLEIVAECVEVGCLDGDAGFKANVGGGVSFGEETPASRFEQLVDLNAGCGFFVGHSDSYLTRTG